MNVKPVALLFLSAVLSIGGLCAAQGQESLPAPTEGAEAEQAAQGKDKKKDPESKKKPAEKKLTDRPETDIFTPTPRAPGDIVSGFNPHMMGDYFGFQALQCITVAGTQTITTTTTTKITHFPDGPPQIITTTKSTSVTKPFSQTKCIFAPIASAGAFKVADNASPRPIDRVFFTWQYFGDIHGLANGLNPSFAGTQTQTATSVLGLGSVTTTTTSVNTSVPAAPQVVANVHREVFGFEKTFLDGRASVELRVPIFQQSSNLNGFGFQQLGDLTIITKYAFILDRVSGNVLSGGLAITAPTGFSINTADGRINPTLLQPWGGYIWNADRFFVQGFHSIVVPTDPRFPTLLFNDVGINYWLYRGEPNAALNFIVPMAEVHVTTPLNNRGPENPIIAPDMVVLTGGVHFGLFRNATLSLGVAGPITGPRIYAVETFMQLNWRF